MKTKQFFQTIAAITAILSVLCAMVAMIIFFIGSDEISLALMAKCLTFVAIPAIPSITFSILANTFRE